MNEVCDSGSSVDEYTIDKYITNYLNNNVSGDMYSINGHSIKKNKINYKFILEKLEYYYKYTKNMIIVTSSLKKKIKDYYIIWNNSYIKTGIHI